MAISSAFRGAYENQIAQQNQGISTITSGAKAAGTAIMGTLGFTGAFGTSTMGTLAAEASEHALAGRIGGIGGNIMLATLKEKKESLKINAKNNNIVNVNMNKPELNTVFEMLNKQGQYSTSIGDIDSNTELGKRITEQLLKEDK